MHKRAEKKCMAMSMAVSRLTCRKTLAGTGLAIFLLLYTNRPRDSMTESGLTFRKTLAGIGGLILSSCIHKQTERTA